MRLIRALIAASILSYAAVQFATLPAAAAPSPDSRAAVNTYARVLRSFNRQLPVWQSDKLAKHLLINSVRWRVDANILVALVSVESSWHTHARSYAGAVGLGQLMPGTARLLHVNPRDPYQNLQGSSHYLSGLLKQFRNSPRRYALAFAAYNAGPKAVTAFGGIPPYYETRHYVVKVMSAWKRVKRELRSTGAMLGTAQPKVKVIYGSPDVQYWTASPPK